MSKKEEKVNEIQDEFNRIQSDHNLDVSKYLATRDDLPDLGEIQIYDYDNDIDESQTQAKDIIDSLVSLYLGDSPSVSSHPYVINKAKEDTQVYAETIFLQRMTRKNFLTQLRQVDNGDNSARMHEVVNQTISQIRENTKFSTTQKTELEKFYKEIRKDLGLNEMAERVDPSIEIESEDDGKIVDSRGLNDMIDKYLREK